MGKLGHLFGANRWEVSVALLPVVADLAHRLVFTDLNAFFLGMLEQPTTRGVAALLGVYAAFCASLLMLGLLRPAIRARPTRIELDRELGQRPGQRWAWPRLIMLYPSLGFGFLLVLAVVQAGGLFADDPLLTEGGQQAVMAVAVGLFFVQVMLTASDFRGRLAPVGPAYLLVMLPVVLVAEVVLNLSGALWTFFLAEPTIAPQSPTTHAVRVLGWSPIFLIFFAAPRFVFQSRHFTWLSALSGIAMALSALWTLLA